MNKTKSESIAHFFFADEYGELPDQLELREVDLIYNDYIRVMTIMYEKLKNTHNTFVNRFLSDKEKKQYNICIENGRFTLNDENDLKEEEK